MNLLKPRGWRAAVVLTLCAWQAACTIHTPFPRWPDSPAGAPDAPVVLVLTRVVLDPQRRPVFDEENRRVIAGMREQPGLIGFSARRELFGDQGWTLSVWASEAARAEFVRSAVHRRAIERGQPALVGGEFKRVTLRRSELPAGWPQALAVLDEPAGRRDDWE